MIRVSACKNSEQYVQSSSITDDIQVAPVHNDEHAFVKKHVEGSPLSQMSVIDAHLLKSFDKNLSSVCFKLIRNDLHSSKSIITYCSTTFILLGHASLSIYDSLPQ